MPCSHRRFLCSLGYNQIIECGTQIRLGMFARLNLQTSTNGLAQLQAMLGGGGLQQLAQMGAVVGGGGGSGGSGGGCIHK